MKRALMIAMLLAGTASLGAVAQAGPADIIQQGVCLTATDAAACNTAGLFDGGIFKTLANLLIFLTGAVGVIMVIVGGLRYVTSQGNPSAVEGAKNTILYAVIGMIIAVMAFAIVNFVLTQVKPTPAVDKCPGVPGVQTTLPC